MSVDLPSSTDPHVTRRRSSACCACSEIADTLAVLHCCFGEAVVCSRFAALGHAGGGDLVDDGFDGGSVGDDAAGTGHVADCAEAHGRMERSLAVHPLDEVRAGVEHAVALEDFAIVREVDPRELELL